jgi:NAD(P)-dependent dehydrogenase (short-subunit alcohol dehydrogenase family)
MGLLDDKVAIITGGANGIGRAHALLFAQQGASVLVNDDAVEDGTDLRTAEQTAAEIRAAGGRAVANSDPVGSFANAEKIVQAAVDAFGGVDILVNNAGILRDRTLLKMAPEEWQAVIDVHLTGTFSCLQFAAKQMIAQGRGGRIINTSSSSGLLGNFGQINYGAAKAGIHMVTRIAAQELAKHRITVNALAPNAYTRMTRDLPGMRGNTLEDFGPQFMAPVVCYLASDKAANITGQTFGANVNQLYIYKMMVSEGVNKKGEPWSPDELGAVIQRVIDW